jgi:hypothetical protein
VNGIEAKPREEGKCHGTTTLLHPHEEAAHLMKEELSDSCGRPKVAQLEAAT